MKKEFNKEEYNKLCAEFLGLSTRNTSSTEILYDIQELSEITIPVGSSGINATVNTRLLLARLSQLKFDSDWNWIMEVVVKIQTLDKLGGIVLIQQGRCKITSRMAGDNSVYADISNYFLKGMKGQKEAVVEAIYQFLIWYNENKK